MAALLDRILWRLRMVWLGWTMPPIAGGSPETEPKVKSDDDPVNDPGDDPDDPVEKALAEGDDDTKVEADDDWKAKARKHERETKRLRKQLEERERKIKEREDEEKSEHEKALEKAREEARKEALTEAEKERRGDRLEVAVTRLSTRGFKIGDGEDAKTVRFADSDDAIVHLERAIARGDIDAEEIYDSEGKVNTDALTTALGELLERKPHLADGERPTPKGDPDARKGDPAQKDLESMTPEDHAKRKYGK